MLTKNLFRRPQNTLEDYDLRLSQPNVPGELYAACPACKAMLLTDELTDDLYVCRKCGHHLRVGARKRIKLLTDENSFAELFGELKTNDPLAFPDYGKKLKSARLASGENEGVLVGTAHIDGVEAAVFAMEPGFMMGSMGTVVGERITRLFEHATTHSLPVVGWTVSGGARVQEGIFSLMQMAKTSAAVMRHSKAGGLFIAVLTDPTTGGVDASFAMEGDITLAEPKALIGFAGPRVIEQTMRQKLPTGFQRSEFLLEKGFVDKIVDRREQKQLLSLLLKLHAREASA